MRSSSSPSTSVSPARCSKRLRLSVPDASITAPGSTAVTRPIGTKIRRRATTSTTRPSTRGAAVPTRSATTTSRTLPTRSPLGSKTVSPASRETYALVAVVTSAEGYRRRRERPGVPGLRDRRRVRAAGVRGQSAGRRLRRRRPQHRAVPGAGVRVPPLRDVVHLRADRAGRRLPGADLHAVRRAAVRRPPERRRGAHAGPHRPAGRGHGAPGVRRRRARPGRRRRRRDADRRRADPRGTSARRTPTGRGGRPGRRRRRRRARAHGRLRPAVRPTSPSRRDAVDRAVPDHAALDALGAGEGVSVLSWDPATSTAYARVFAGDLRWGEDPATGSAALGTGVWLVADRPARPATGRRRTPSGRARSWAGRRCCPARSPRPAGARERPPSAAPSCRSRAVASGSRRERGRPRSRGVGAAPSRRPRDGAHRDRRRRHLAVRRR